MIYISTTNTLFINVPKNASNSFRTLLKPKAALFSSEHLTLVEIEQRFIMPPNVNIIAIVREPLERLLSLYLYRIMQKRYDVLIPSPQDFKKRVIEGGGKLIDHPWQMCLQSDYLPRNKGTWWDYKHINKLARTLSNDPLPWENKTTSISYELLISKFYDNELNEIVSSAYKPDIDLYKEINSACT